MKEEKREDRKRMGKGTRREGYSNKQKVRIQESGEDKEERGTGKERETRRRQKRR